MNKMLGARLGITLTAFALIISIIAFIGINTGGVAWYSGNKNTEAGGMTVNTIDSEKKVEAVDFFKIGKIVLESDGSNTYFFRQVKESGSTVPLAEHSALVAERQVLVRFTLADGVDSITLSAESNAENYIVLADITSNEPTRVYKENNSISSIIQFQYVSAIGEETASFVLTDADGAQSTVTEKCYKISGNDASETSHFSDITVSGATLSRDFSKDIEIKAQADGIESSGKKYVYVIVDYYEDATEDVQQHVNNLIMSEDANNDYTDVTSGEVLNFICDFKFIVK